VPALFDQTASASLEAVYLTPDVTTQREATLAALDPRPGDRAIDVGVGPGLLAADIAQAVGPDGHVTGIDVSTAMLDIARRRCAAAGAGDRVTLAHADATTLPLPDETCDLAVTTQVLEYVPDVDVALAELHRVLRPGGRLVIVDTDWDSLVWNSSNPDRMHRILNAWTRRFADPHLPRSLTPRLHRTGFTIINRDAHTILNPEYDPQTYSVTNTAIMARFVATQGIPPSEIEDWLNDLQQLGNEGRYFFSLTRYLFTATRTQPRTSLPAAGAE
jgi:ubiquinone/menaquinone biosynthesis C-methylase UbiE